MQGARSISGEAHPRTTLRLGDGEADIARAAAMLARGGLAAFPTETVYGLGADAEDKRAVAALYAAKARPRFNPLIAHVADVAAARREARLDHDAEALADAFWPGPLTLVLPLAEGSRICDLARAGLDSVALRVPSHPVARRLLALARHPIVAPSANRSGRLSPTEAGHVLADLDGRIDALVDGGTCGIGLESTIVACLGGAPRLLRPGGVTREAIARVLGRELDLGAQDPAAPRAPGALSSHYAPRARVRLGATSIRPCEAALLFGGKLPGADAAAASLDLSPKGDLAEAAANLFGHLRRLDASGAGTIAVAPIPETGLGEAIADRLRRAAAER